MRGKKRNKTLTMQEYVNATYDILLEEGIDNLSIRKIANNVGCDSAVLYRHFQSLDYLIVLGSIRFLEDYVQRLLDIEKRKESNIDRVIDSWKVLCHTSFENPSLYYHLLYDCDQNLFEDAIVEYYQLFPLQLINRDDLDYGFFFESLFSGNSFERNRFYFMRAANEHSIKQADVDFLSVTCSSIASGMLHENLGGFNTDLEKVTACNQCLSYVNRIIESCRIDEHVPPEAR